MIYWNLPRPFPLELWLHPPFAPDAGAWIINNANSGGSYAIGAGFRCRVAGHRGGMAA